MGGGAGGGEGGEGENGCELVVFLCFLYCEVLHLQLVKNHHFLLSVQMITFFGCCNPSVT